MSENPDTTALEAELDELGDEATIDEASDAESLRQAIEARASEVRRWLDELRVQADLGGMDAKAVLGDVLARLEDAAAAFASLARQAAGDLDTDDLKARSRAAAHDLRRAGETALQRLRSGSSS
jgi:hypothetical protein